MILSLIVLCLCSAGHAQVEARVDAPAGAAAAEPNPAAADRNAADSAARSEWLPSFTSVVVSGPFDIAFVQVPDTQAPRIEYDTKGSYTTRFRFEVKDKVLRITERTDTRRPERTAVKVCYNAVDAFTITDAAATFDGTLTASILDLTVGGRGSLAAALDVEDLKMELSGHSKAVLTGKVRYLSLLVSSGAVDAAELEVMAAQVNATSGGAVTLTVTDRLEATTSTKGTIDYKGRPAIVRGGSKFLGGAIGRIEE